jgi:dihydrofolate synthase/folylpolyglutamate synthase
MSSGGRWSQEDAERYLLSLELFGMRFGLDRMHRLMTALQHPERQFDSIHVVGTNGKSSTVRMIAAILQRHGPRVGAYTSPHLVSFCERIRVNDADLHPAAFGSAVQRAARAAELVDRSLAGDDRVTQFEALTAAAYAELAARDVDVAVVEAGLGGRFDATNVIPSRVQVLTSVGLEHTRWLGPTIADIAREKLAVVKGSQPSLTGGDQVRSTLVLAPGLHPDAEREALAIAARADARIVHAGTDPGVELGALGAFQRRNFAVARAAAEAYLGKLDSAAVSAAAAEVRVPGRLQIIGESPLTLLDGAHNPDGVSALVESVKEIVAGRRLVAAVSILDDKDAASMLRMLMPICDALVLTSSQNPRALPPPTLASLARQLDGPPSELVRDPRAALERARELAGSGGVALATGSIYLIADLVRPAGQARASML